MPRFVKQEVNQQRGSVADDGWQATHKDTFQRPYLKREA